MPRNIPLFVLLFASLLTVRGQMPPENNATEDRTPTVRGVTVPDVANLPFSATVVMEVDRYWPDGSTQIRRTINLIARDSQGRTHNEVRRLMPEYFHGSPELMSVRLFDPLTRIRTTFYPALHTARQQLIPQQQPKPAAPPANTAVRIDDLGTTIMNGLQAKGTRRTRTDYGGRDGPVEVEDEEWYSADLHLNLLVRHSDPRFGVETLGISNLKREEPPVSMFRVPPGYTIVDATPAPAGSSPSHSNGGTLETNPPL
jgi:hypothetical protein